MRCAIVLLSILSCTGAATASESSPARVVIAGDSTAATYPASRAPQAGWGQVLDYFLRDDVVVANRAVGGRSTKSYIDEGKWGALLDEVSSGDVVLISFGHNDARDDAPTRYTRPDAEFRQNLIRFARDVQGLDATPVLLSPAARRLWEAGTVIETHGLYAQNTLLAADAANAMFIDLANLSVEYFETLSAEATKSDYLWLSSESGNDRFPDGAEDNTHFTALGACGVARLIAISLADHAQTARLVNTLRTGRDSQTDPLSRPDSVRRCASAAVWSP